MKKIIGLIHTRFSQTGGVEKYINKLVPSLLDRNWQVHYFAAKIEQPVPEGMTVHHIPVIRGTSSTRMLSFAYGARRTAKKANLPLLMGFGRTIYQDIYRDGSGCFLDYERHAIKRFHPLYRKSYLHIERKRFDDPLLRKVIGISQMVKDQIIQRYHLPSEKIVVVYNGVNPNDLKLHLKDKKTNLKEQLGLSPETLTALFIGNDFGRKGLKYLIEAFGLLPSTLPIILLVAGKDKHQKDYEQLSRETGCAQRIHFIGYQDDVGRLYAAADLFILPSLFDPFGSVVLESLYSGTPVLTGPSVGAGELIVNGVNGFVVPDYKPETLAKAILKFNSREQRDKMSKNARRMAADYRWDVHIERLEELLLQVLEQKLTHARSS